MRERARHVGRYLLGGFFTFAGVAHLSFARQEFRAQVPDWFPVGEDAVILISGVMEIALGLALLAAPRRWRPHVGWVAAAFLVAVFPGNINQFVTSTDAFGLDTDRARGIRLLFQPMLIIWALWSTRAWADRQGLTGRPDSV